MNVREVQPIAILSLLHNSILNTFELAITRYIPMVKVFEHTGF